MYSTTCPECFVFNDGNSNNNALATAALMNNGGFGGGMNNPFWAFILLAFLRQWGWDGNGNGGNGCGCLTQNQLSAIQETLNTNQGNTLLMNAITGNGTGIKELASAIGCNHNAVTAAINAIQGAIANVSNQNNMNAMQTINSIQSGNTAIANQISQCCCDNKLLATQQGYENRIATLNQTNQLDRAIAGVDSTVVKGFCDTAYATQQQTSALAANQDANTRAVLAKLDQIEDSRKDREINALTAQVATLTARSERAAELGPIYKTLEEIKGKQPSVATVPYPNLVGIPASMLYGGAIAAGAAAGVFGVGGNTGGIFG